MKGTNHPGGTLVAEIQLRANVRWLLVAFGATAAVFVLIGLGVALHPTASGGVWDSARYVLPWLLFSAGIAFGMWFPLAVAHGVTRRDAWSGTTLAAAVLAVAGAVLTLGGHLVEWAAFRLTGSAPSASLALAPRLLVEDLLGFTAMLVSGLLIFIGYYRTNGLVGTLLIPVGMLPALGTYVAISAGWGPDRNAGEGAWIGILDWPVAILLAAGVVALGLGALRLITRTMPISGSVV